MNFKLYLITIFLIYNYQSFAQLTKVRNGISYIPQVETKINGIATGIFINSMKHSGDSLTTQINGISIELVGIGFFLPLAPTDVLYDLKEEDYKKQNKLDSVLKTFHKINYKINGLSLSGGGLGGHEILINGVSLSAINNLNGRLNGVSICPLFNAIGRSKGLSIGLFNWSIETIGLQIGGLNSTKKLKGIQIGIWNTNQKRALPFINWSFKD